TSESDSRRAAPGLSRRGNARAAAQRRNRDDIGRALRGAVALPDAGAAERAVRVVGPIGGPPRRRSQRHAARAAVPARPNEERNTVTARGRGRRAHVADRGGNHVAVDDHRDGAASAPAHHRVRPGGPAAGVRAEGLRLMDARKLSALYGLKWNPFLEDIPVEALCETPRIKHFAWRVEDLVMHGGFALVTGDVGAGKSAARRMLASKLSPIRDTIVGESTRPQSLVTAFYRELGDHFVFPASTSNRWGAYKTVRAKWQE